MKPLTVGILADLPPGLGGGVNYFTRAFVQALIATLPADLRVVVFVQEGDSSWSLPNNHQVTSVAVQGHRFRTGYRRWLERSERYGRAAFEVMRGDFMSGRVARRFGERTQRLARALRRSPWKLDVMHFPFQSAAPVGMPAIVGLWDLQYLHLPELRSPAQIRQLDDYYRWCCRLARRVTFGSEWARRDAVDRFGLPFERTAVVRAASPLRALPAPTDEALADVRRRHSLPDRFAFYPAVAWPHKNHKALISAVARLRDAEVADLHVVCSGHADRYLAGLEAHAEHHGVGHRVHFLGYVPEADVKALYRLAAFCVYPSLFEGAGLPVLEAFDERCPITASAVGSIPEYAGDAALLFDPRSVEAIAGAMARMATDEGLRRTFVARGAERAATFSWGRVAAEFRDLYRELADAGEPAPLAQA